MRDAAIYVEGLTKAYGDHTAVDEISFTVKQGQLFALLGPNGAGKTTTMNILSTCNYPDAGCVKIDGLTLGRNNHEIRKRIGIVFQNGLLDELLTVEENLSMRGSFYGLRGKHLQERVLNISKLTDVTGLLLRPYGKLSGGQKRRCDIARALMHMPKILFLDEPTTGLDPEVRTAIWQTIRNIQKQTDMTIVLTTHYMEEATLADEIVVLKDGKIVASEHPCVLKQKYSQDRLVMLTENSAKITKILIENCVPFCQQGRRFEINISSTLEALPLLELCRGGFSSFEVMQGSLEDAYLSIIRGGFSDA